jgi:hypothetical protein
MFPSHIYDLYKKLRNQVGELEREDALRVIWAFTQYLQVGGFEIPKDIEVDQRFYQQEVERAWINEWSLALLDVEFGRRSRGERGAIVAARIDDVNSINVFSLNVLEHEGQTFTCEPEVEAEISLDIDIEVEGGYGHGPDEYEPDERYSVSQTQVEYFYPEVIVRFDLSTGALEFESISLGSQTVRISMDDVKVRSYR